ncbi:hypothetical protein EV360DRAFT_88815 [Lentinula raphanica]|nr:hypothetical protein EV360DRAFT_88815 [Lentinula raphanica]
MSRTPQDWPPMSVGPPMLPSPLRPWRPRPRDPEEYDFETLDTVPEDCAVFFVMATYGEGEPTDNAFQLMQNLQDDSLEFSKGRWDLSGLKYVVHGLGNKTYEHYNVTSKYADNSLEKMGATRIGDGTLEAFASAIGVEGGNTAHFAVRELEPHPAEKVYLGELSARALTKTKGIHDAKNPYPAPLTVARELFQDPKDRNCVHVELNTEGSGITYQHADHAGVWPSNPELHVDRLLLALGLYDKKDKVIHIDSLEPALAKVPFPVPTTYTTVLRHYIDISALAGRQMLGTFAQFAPNPDAEAAIKELNTHKEIYLKLVADGCLKAGEVLQIAAGNDIRAIPTLDHTTAWPIPYDIIVSSIPRLQPRHSSISSSPKLHRNSIHITCVVLKYQSSLNDGVPERWVYGAGSNFPLNLRNGKETLISDSSVADTVVSTYAIEAPRTAYRHKNTEEH